MEKFSFDLDDDYLTCAKTHATLCIYLPDSTEPNTVSEELNIKPTRTQIKGEVRNGKSRLWPTAWFLESQGNVESKDLRKHINWLLNCLYGKSEFIRQLQNSGSQIGISCMWTSAFGHGGPMLDSDILKRISELNLGIDFDIYFDEIEL